MNFTSLPIRLDLFSVFLLLGWVQGLILAYFFLSNFQGKRFSNLYLGILILGMSLLTCDVWLGYTNLMLQVMWLNDATEPINLMLAPMAYLYITTSLAGKNDRRAWLHFVPAMIYFVYACILIYPQNQNFKLHLYLQSFHPDIPDVQYAYYGSGWMFFLKAHINDFTFVSLIAYNVAMLLFLLNAFRERGIPFFTRIKSSLSWYRDMYLHLSLLVIIFCIVRLTFPRDLGDHIIVAFIVLIIYIVGFTVLRKSLFYDEYVPKQVKKYEKSSLTEEIQTSAIRKLREVMEEEKPFMDPLFSMPVLARKMGISTHHLSQILNEELGQSFFDFLAGYRIREAQKLLSDAANDFIKIEEIAQIVGYNSKSAFNTAFRKIVGITPSEFKKSGRSL